MVTKVVPVVSNGDVNAFNGVVVGALDSDGLSVMAKAPGSYRAECYLVMPYHSVSQASGKAGSVSYFKAAGIVIVSCLFVKVTINSSWGNATIGRLPEGFRPAGLVVAPIASDWASGSMSIAADGTVSINSNDNTISTAASISSTAVFPAA